MKLFGATAGEVPALSRHIPCCRSGGFPISLVVGLTTRAIRRIQVHSNIEQCAICSDDNEARVARSLELGLLES